MTVTKVCKIEKRMPKYRRKLKLYAPMDGEYRYWSDDSWGEYSWPYMMTRHIVGVGRYPGR